ncbi:MAG: TonB-dependent receptor [Verrucomicrobia bacterium]|nr:TonB-dependent receptor [Verrucomicrobiota bacterium]
MLIIAATVCAWPAETEPAEKPSEAPKELSLDELVKLEIPTVFGASKLEQKTTEAPSSVTIVGSDEIKKYGYRTLADLLQSVQGFHVTYDRNYSFLGTRGFNSGVYPNSRVLLLVNGHRVNNSLFDGGFIGTEFILDVDLIDKVEIIRGPGSVLYGNNAFFGVINVRTRSSYQINGLEASGEVASFDTYKGRVTYGTRFKNDVELVLSGSLYDSQGPERLFYKEFNTPQNNNGIAQGMDDDAFKSLFASIAYRDFALEGGFITRDKKNPTAQFATTLPDPVSGTNRLVGTIFNDPRFLHTVEQAFMNLRFSHDLSDTLGLTAQAYYDRSKIGFDLPSFVLSPLPLNSTVDIGEWFGMEIQLKKSLFERHTITVGGEYRNDFRQERRNFDVEPFKENGTVKDSSQSYGAYAEGDFALFSKLHLNAGVRFDQYKEFESTANPRVALIFNPFEASVIKAIYGTAFRAPTFVENINKASELRPETIDSYELVYEQGIGDHLRSSVSGFYSEVDSLISFEGSGGLGQYRNLEGARVKGIETGLEAYWASGVRGRASYAFQQTEDRNTGRILPDSPKHLGKVSMSAPLVKEKVFAGLEWQYTSHRTTQSDTKAAGFGLVNVTLFSRNLVKGFELAASAYNLFDRAYADPATFFHLQDLIERDGRTFRVKLTYAY